MTDPRSLLSGILTAVCVGGLLSACGPRIPATITIGVAQPLSGPSAARGQDIVNGAKLAAADLNAAGFKVAGKPVQIEIVAVDDKADKEEAKKVAQGLVDQKVTAVIGHLSSDVTESVIPVYRSGNVPQFFTSSAAELTRLGQGNTFRLIANDELQARAIASYAGETLHAGKVAILHEDTAFGTPLAKAMTAALAKQNKKVEYTEAIDNKTTNFAPFVAKLKAARPEVVVAMVRDHQLLPLFDQMNAAGLGDVPVIAHQRRQDAASRDQRRHQDALPDLQLRRGRRVRRRQGVRQEISRRLQIRPGLGGALRLRRRLRAGRHDPAHRIGRPGRAAGPADGHRRDRAGDDDDAFQRRRRAALRRDQRLPATRREVGPADALGSLVIAASPRPASGR